MQGNPDFGIQDFLFAEIRKLSGEFLLVELRILEFGTWNSFQGIRNPTDEWYLEFSTWNPESMACNPESKTV